MLADVSAKIADINTNITQHRSHAPTTTAAARIDMTVEISDVKHLEKVIKSLRSVDGVLDVERAGSAGAAGDGRQRCATSERLAMTSISTRASLGSRATCTVARAGAGAVKYVA